MKCRGDDARSAISRASGKRRVYPYRVVPYETTGHLRPPPWCSRLHAGPGARLSIGYRHDCPRPDAGGGVDARWETFAHWNQGRGPPLPARCRHSPRHEIELRTIYPEIGEVRRVPGLFRHRNFSNCPGRQQHANRNSQIGEETNRQSAEHDG